MINNQNQNHEEARQTRDSQSLVPYQDPEGKWLSVKLYPDELVAVVGIQLAFRKLGLGMSQSKIIRQFMSIGLDNIDVEQVKKNPLSLFLVKEEVKG